MDDQEVPHKHHKQHLCYLESVGFLEKHPEEYKALVRNAEYFCSVCGRSAFAEENLCDPAAI